MGTLCLGIESTAHSFGIGIVNEKGEILVNEKTIFRGEGMDLRSLSDFLTENFNKVLETSIKKLKEQNLSLTDINLISFSRGPGLGNSLKIGALVAKTLALRLKIPIVGVNHIKAHLNIGKLMTGLNDPLYLYVSGVNTQIIAEDKGKHKIYGETEDIGIGNLIDSVGRELELEFPAGPTIEKLAEKGEKFIELPYTIKGMNLSLSGLASKIKQLKKTETKEDISFSLQETIFAMLTEIVERALAYTNKKEYTIVGGVASNSRLRDMAEKMGKDRNIHVKFFHMEYCMDNGAMIAWQGIIDKEKSQYSIENLKPLPYINIESEI